jgi:hypothetical protein
MLSTIKKLKFCAGGLRIGKSCFENAQNKNFGRDCAMTKSELAALRKLGPLAGARTQFSEVLGWRVPHALLRDIDEILPLAAAAPVKIMPIACGYAKSGKRPIERVTTGIFFTTCQWLDGEPKERNFCGSRTRGGRPFCDRHHRICWRKP